MIKKLYVVWDTVAVECGPIFEAKNDGVALRSYERLIASKGADGVNVEEFKLYCLGSIDSDNMTIFGEGAREVHISLAVEGEEDVVI